MKMTLVVLGALGLTMVLQRRSAALRHWVLAAGIGCSALVPLLTAVLPSWTLPMGTPSAFISVDGAESAAVSPAAPAASRPQSTSRVAAPTPPPVATGGSRSVWIVLERVWWAGAALGLGVLLTGALRLTWLASRSRPVVEGRWREMADGITREYGLRRTVTILQSDHPALLVTWGIAQPKVILPAVADTWSDDRARVVLSHELAHISRGDWIVQLAAEVMRALYWFDPIVWVACRRLRLESEHACDDEVMTRGVAGADYATHLIDLARALNGKRQAWLPAPAMARPSSLERRVRAMLNDHRDTRRIGGVTRTLVLVMLLSAAAVVAAAQTTYRSFTGVVADEQGRGVSGAAVALNNEERQAKYEIKTGADGRFDFVGLLPGEYSVSIERAGFQTVRDVLNISAQNAQRNFTLQLGTLQETIMVRADPNKPANSEPAASAVKEVPMPAPRQCEPSAGGGQIVPPKKVRDVPPHYPPSLVSNGIQGTVVLRGRIASDGYISDITILKEAHPELAQSAIEAVRGWRYTETLLNCVPAEPGITITTNFSLSAAQ